MVTYLKKQKSFWLLFLLCLLFFILRFPSLFEPYWYGDEGIYQVIGRGLREGKNLYQDIWDNKPPLLYFIYAIFNADQFVIRLVSLGFGVASVISFYLLSKKLFGRVKQSLLATSFFALFFALPTIEGNIANAENFMLFFSITAGVLLLRALQEKTKQKTALLVLSGALLGVEFLFKIVGIFDTTAFLLFILFTTGVSVRQLFTSSAKSLVLLRVVVPILAGFLFPIGIIFVYFFMQGTAQFFVDAVFKQNVGYVGLRNDLLIPNGLLFLKFFLLLVGLGLLYWQRAAITKPKLFILLWLIFSLFSAFFSGRPYTHYQLVILPAISLLFGYIFIKQPNRHKVALSLLWISTICVVYLSFRHWDSVRTAAYYQNFVDFVSNRKDVFAYQSFFDKHTPRDYEIALFIRNNTKHGDSVYLWGNSAQIYVLSNTFPPGRYTVAYHIGVSKAAVDETTMAIEKTKPKYIIIMPDQEYVPFDLHGYSYKVTVEDTHIYERQI